MLARRGEAHRRCSLDVTARGAWTARILLCKDGVARDVTLYVTVGAAHAALGARTEAGLHAVRPPDSRRRCARDLPDGGPRGADEDGPSLFTGTM